MKRPFSVDEARAEILQKVEPLAPFSLPLEQAHRYVLRAPVLADADQPGFDRSAMDGYAVRTRPGMSLPPEIPCTFSLIGTISTGRPSELQLEPGQAARIYTGGPVPSSATLIVPQELVVRPPDADAIRVTEWPLQGVTHIRRQGEDLHQGDPLCEAGTVLAAVELSLLASGGVRTVSVSPRPRVLHLTTGDELVPFQETPGPGQIRDSHAILVGHLVEEAGGELIGHCRVGDHPEVLINTVLNFPHSFDLLLISGGSSGGDYDFTGHALESLGYQLHFNKVEVRPGKPLLFGTLSPHKIAFGLPGNPVSHLVTFRVFVQAALQRLQALVENRVVHAPLMRDLEEPLNSRETFWPAHLEPTLRLRPLSWNSSGHLASLVEANALIRIPASTPALPAGTLVEGWLLPGRY